MKDEMKKYLVPSYYKNFSCKCGKCRNSCCKGWNISISMNEYYSLSTLDCSKEIRNKLDRALKVLNKPTKEKYAILASNYFGDCFLHDEDGYCALQKECGEKSLPQICRMYPRSTCNSFLNQACVSNSCERVIEILMENTDKLEFLNLNTSLYDNKENISIDDESYGLQIQQICIEVISDRNYPLMVRLIRLEELIIDLEKNGFDVMKNNYQNNLYSQSKKDIVDYDKGAKLHLDVLKIIGEKSPSLSEYLLDIENYYHINLKTDDINDFDGKGKLYLDALHTFKEKNPNWDIFVEKVLINHMFYISFPFEDESLNGIKNKKVNYYKQFVALFEAYCFFKFVVSSYMKVKNEETNYKDILVDITGEVFRLIEHSSFDNNVSIILFNEKYFDKESLDKLLD